MNKHLCLLLFFSRFLHHQGIVASGTQPMNIIVSWVAICCAICFKILERSSPGLLGDPENSPEKDQRGLENAVKHLIKSVSNRNSWETFRKWKVTCHISYCVITYTATMFRRVPAGVSPVYMLWYHLLQLSNCIPSSTRKKHVGLPYRCFECAIEIVRWTHKENITKNLFKRGK